MSWLPWTTWSWYAQIGVGVLVGVPVGLFLGYLEARRQIRAVLREADQITKETTCRS